MTPNDVRKASLLLERRDKLQDGLKEVKTHNSGMLEVGRQRIYFTGDDLTGWFKQKIAEINAQLKELGVANAG